MKDQARINTMTGRPWRPRLKRPRLPSVGIVVAAFPLLTVLVMAALMGLLVWIVDRRDHSDRRDELIRDALWVEQALRFQITAVEEVAERLALDLSGQNKAEAGANATGDRLKALLTAHPEIRSAKVVRPDGRVIESIPQGASDSGPDVVQNDLAEQAQKVGRARFGPPRRDGASMVIDMATALSGGGRDGFVSGGALILSLDLERLLAHHVPWWITQQNDVSLSDTSGAVLATKSANAIEPGHDSHVISLDPPLPGVTIVLTRRSARSSLASNSLMGAIFALSAVAVISIFALQRHWRRRLAAETDLKEAHAFRKAMEESLTVGMRARDLTGRIIYVNPAFCRMVGMRPEELVGREPPMPYWDPALIEETMARHEMLAHEFPRAKSFETRFVNVGDRRGFDVLVYEAPLIDAQGLHRGWMGSIIDITDRKATAARERLQAETMQRAARLTAMGEMASTIAHELNQPLAAIASYAAGTLNRVRSGRIEPQSLTGALEKLDEQAQRAGRIIRRVHDFVRKRDPVFAPLDLPPVVTDLTTFLAPTAARMKAVLVESVATDLAMIRADRILIEQVLLNLARNALEAMLTVPEAERRLEISATSNETELVIEIADHGPGIPPEIAERLFEPFVSSKPEGMGMGLSICRTIIELHQGRLDHRAGAGGGTVFSVILPVWGDGEQT